VADPHKVTRDFEAAMCEYTGAPYCVTTNSCTMALLLAVAWHLRPGPQLLRDEYGSPELRREQIEIPARTYVGVPMSIIHAGGQPGFRDEDWSRYGYYRLRPLSVWDSARFLSAGMFEHFAGSQPSPMVCLSFHATKTLGIEQGGAILLESPDVADWLRRMRFDGRTEGVPVKDDDIRDIGWHCYMNPSTAAQGLMRMAGLPKHNAPLPMSDYPDLSLMNCFR